MTPTRAVLAFGILGLLALGWLLLGDSSDRGRPGPPPTVAREADGERAPAELLPPESLPPRPGPEREAASRPEAAGFPEPEAPGRPGAWVRLLARDTRAPLRGFEAVFSIFDPRQPVDARPISVATSSDAEGLIDLLGQLPPENEALRLRVKPRDPRLELTPATFPRSELGATPARAVELLLAPRAAATFRGRALDARTGEPIPSLAFRVSAWNEAPSDDPDRPRPGSDADGWRAVGFQDRDEWLVTDASGSFRGERDFPVGRLTLTTLHGEASSVTLDPAGSPVEARFVVGPVLLLDFHPPGGRTHEDFIAALYRAPSEVGLDEELLEARSPWSSKDTRSRHASPVRPGPPPWVRLSANELEHPLPSFLILLSRDGAAKGVARVDSLERYRHVPLFVDLEELCALQVNFRQSPEAGPRPCQLDLLARETGEHLATRWGNTRTQVRFQGLAAGLYRLELRIEQREPMRLEVSLPRPDPVEFELLDVANERYTLEGEVQTDSGLPLDGQEGRPILQISALNNLVGRGARLSWEGGRARFQVPDLEAGEYRLLASFQSGGFEVEPRNARVLLPGPPVTLRVLDGGPREFLELWVLNPPTQGELVVEGSSEIPQLRFDATIESNEPLDTLPDGRPGRHIVRGPYPAGAITTLRLRGEGRRMMTLSTRDFRHSEERLTLEVTMLDGWSARLNLTDEENASVAGVVLALDGTPLPPSDKDGFVQVEADAKPARLSVVTPGWRLVEHHSWEDWGTVFESGEFTVEDGLLDVFLHRE